MSVSGVKENFILVAVLSRAAETRAGGAGRQPVDPSPTRGGAQPQENEPSVSLHMAPPVPQV